MSTLVTFQAAPELREGGYGLLGFPIEDYGGSEGAVSFLGGESSRNRCGGHKLVAGEGGLASGWE